MILIFYFLSGKPDVVQISDAPLESIQVLATCHSLVQLDDGIVGDPLEKATLKAINWNLTKGRYKFANKIQYKHINTLLHVNVSFR